MCSIICSFKSEKFKELVKINQYRGSFSHSLTQWNIDKKEFKILQRDFGPFNNNILPNDSSLSTFYIGHVQMPTGGLSKDLERIHPSTIAYNNQISLLYHNGILKENQMKYHSLKYKPWDTHELHQILRGNKFNSLSKVDGSFGCIYIHNKQVMVFTTTTITLFVDNVLNISSVKFENSKRIKPNVVWLIDFDNFKLKKIATFNSKSDPYYLA